MQWPMCYHGSTIVDRYCFVFLLGALLYMAPLPCILTCWETLTWPSLTCLRWRQVRGYITSFLFNFELCAARSVLVGKTICNYWLWWVTNVILHYRHRGWFSMPPWSCKEGHLYYGHQAFNSKLLKMYVIKLAGITDLKLPLKLVKLWI